MINYTRWILTTRVWNCQLRINIFPPYLKMSNLESKFEDLSNVYNNYLEVWRFGLSYWWDVDANMPPTTGSVMPGQVPVLHFFLFPMEFWENFNDVIQAWVNPSEYSFLASATNQQYFLMDVIQKSQHVYHPGSILHVNQNLGNKVTTTKLKDLDPNKIQNFLSSQLSNSQTYWRIQVFVPGFASYFENCEIKLRSAGVTWSADHLLNQAVAQVWQAILKNHTYKSVFTKCSNGKRTNERENMETDMNFRE